MTLEDIPSTPACLASWTRGAVPYRIPEATHRSPLIEASPTRALFRLLTVGRFLVEPHRPALVQQAANACEEDIECFAGGTVAALRLCLEKEFSLRGSAVEIGGKAVVMIGTACGTSTLAAALAQRGHALLADGMVPVPGSAPGVRPLKSRPATTTLWPDSVEWLGLDQAAGRTVRPGLRSRAFTFGTPPAPGTVAVGAIVVPSVDFRLQGSCNVSAPEKIGGFQATMQLLQAQWHPRVIADLGLQAHQHHWLTNLAGRAPMYRLRRRGDAPTTTISESAERIEELVG